MNPSSSSSSSMCELDNDTLSDILSRLPAKSLVRLTSVCRLWKSITSSPQFRLASNRPTRLLVHTFEECYTVVEGDVAAAHELQLFEADLPLRRIGRAFILGSDNGLICIAIDSCTPYPRFVIWNPSIRKHVVFPNHQLDDNFYSYFSSAGFGATLSGLDYKFVRLVGYTAKFAGKGGTQKTAFHIYSLKAGTWRRLDLNFKSCLRMEFGVSPALLRGRLHWVVNDSSSCLNMCTNYISTLDLEDEVFENKAMMLPQPISTGPDFPIPEQDVTVIKESLAVITFEFRRNCTVWVMKEYGDVGSWVKWCSIDLTIGIFNVMHDIEMVGVLKNGDVLLGLCGRDCPSKFVTCDPKTMKTNDFFGGTGVLLSPSQVCGFTNYYKESLVLLADYEDRAVPDHKF